MDKIKVGALVYKIEKAKDAQVAESLIYIDSKHKSADKSYLYTQIAIIEDSGNGIEIYPEFVSGSMPKVHGRYATDIDLRRVMSLLNKQSGIDYINWIKEVYADPNILEDEKKRIKTIADKIKPKKMNLRIHTFIQKSEESIKVYGKTRYWLFRHNFVLNGHKAFKWVRKETKECLHPIISLITHPESLQQDLLYIGVGWGWVCSERLVELLKEKQVGCTVVPLEVISFEGDKIQNNYYVVYIKKIVIDIIDKEKSKLSGESSSMKYKSLCFNENANNIADPIITDKTTRFEFMRDDVKTAIRERGITGFIFLHPLRSASGEYWVKGREWNPYDD